MSVVLFLLCVAILLWLVFRPKKPVRVGDPNAPTEVLLERQRAAIRDAERKRPRDESSGNDGPGVVHSLPFAGGKNAKTIDHHEDTGTGTKDAGSFGDSGGSSDGGDGGD